jgi:hypothetical protein
MIQDVYSFFFIPDPYPVFSGQKSTGSRIQIRNASFSKILILAVFAARSRILYVSETVGDILNFTPRDLMGQSLFDILHPKVTNNRLKYHIV